MASNGIHPSPASSSSSSGEKPTLSRLALLEKQRLLLSSLPNDYSPPPSPPLSSNNLALLNERIVSSGYSWEVMRLGSVRRGYKPAPVLPTRAEHAEPDLEREWFLAETEEEWFEWERKVKNQESLNKKVENWKAGFGDSTSQDARAPASFEALLNANEKENQESLNLVNPKASVEALNGSVSAVSANEKRKVASTLDFPVVKRSQAAAAKIANKDYKASTSRNTPHHHSSTAPFSQLDAPLKRHQELVYNDRPQTFELGNPTGNASAIPASESHALDGGVVRSRTPPLHNGGANERKDEGRRTTSDTPEAGLEVRHSLTSTMTPPGFAFIGKAKEMAEPMLVNAKERQEMILRTPETKNLPTLTELMASSKKPRTAMSGKKREAAANNTQDNPEGARLSAPLTPELSPDHQALILPQTPLASIGAVPGLFTQIHAGFLPEYTSSQFPGQGENFGGGTTGSGGGVPGFLGYGSQCEVDGQASELLERDVDFDGWLRDVAADEK